MFALTFYTDAPNVSLSFTVPRMHQVFSGETVSKPAHGSIRPEHHGGRDNGPTIRYRWDSIQTAADVPTGEKRKEPSEPGLEAESGS